MLFKCPLDLRVVDMHPADKLTDVAVMQGFSNLQNLEFLNLSRSQVIIKNSPVLFFYGFIFHLSEY